MNGKRTSLTCAEQFETTIRGEKIEDKKCDSLGTNIKYIYWKKKIKKSVIAICKLKNKNKKQ